MNNSIDMLNKDEGALITILEINDFDAAAEVLTRAFFEDPVFQYILPNPESRLERLKWLLTRWVRIMAPRGFAIVADGGHGVLIAIPPGKDPEVSILAQLRHGLLLAPFHLGPGGVSRLLTVDADMKRRHGRDLNKPHWVVDIVGVDPGVQGRGIGHALLTSVLKQARLSKNPCYVITHNQRNVTFYQRLGFEIINKAPVCHNGPTAWSLRRRA